MFDFIAHPMGQILKFIYGTLAFKNYGFAIILLTVIIRAALLPLYIKQYQSTAKMSNLQPQLQEIQKRYKNDKEKLNEEIMKLYQDNKVNPAGGCLPLFIQMPILFSLYYVISQPLKFMYGKSLQVIQQLFDTIPTGPDKLPTMHDLSIMIYYGKNPDKLSNVSQFISKNDILNMQFLGINLGAIPTLDFHRLAESSANLTLLLIPILAVLTTFISVKYSMKQSSQVNTYAQQTQMQNSMQNSMALISPLMTGFISFTVPAGLGLYWIIGNIIQVFQQMFINRFIIKQKKDAILKENCSQ